MLSFRLNMISLFSNRKDRKAAKFHVRVSDKKGSEFTVTARNNLLIEHALVSSKKIDGTVSELYGHYGISQQGFSWLKKTWNERTHLESKKRKGRPTLKDDVAETELREATRANRRATPRQICYQVKGSSGGGNYRGEKKEHVSHTTIYSWKKLLRYVGKSIKPRPTISPQNAVERKACASKLISAAHLEHTRVDVDEKIFRVPGISGTLSYHEDSDDEDDEHYKSLGHKSHQN